MGCLCCCCCQSGEQRLDQGMEKKSNRKCTDIIPLLFFIIFVGGLIAVAAYAWENGDPFRILYGADSFGNTCGRKNDPLRPLNGMDNVNIRVPFSGSDMTAKTYMFPLDIRHPLSTLWICVEECPNVFISEYQKLENHNMSLCVTEQASKHASQHKDDGWCPVLPIHASVPLLNRCLPRDILRFGDELAEEIVSSIKDIDWARSILNDIITSSKTIAAMIGVALVFSFVLIYLFRFVAPIAVYAVYILLVLVFLGMSGGLWCTWWYSFGQERLSHGLRETSTTTTEVPVATIKLAEYTVLENGTAVKMDTMPMTVDELRNFSMARFLENQPGVSESTLIGICFASTIITFVAVVVTWCVLPRGKAITSLFKQASEALKSMPCLMVQPLITVCFVVVFSVSTVISALVIYTSAEPVPIVLKDNFNLTVIRYNLTMLTKVMLVYEAIGYIWLSEFFFAYQRMLIVGAVANWYFEGEKCHSPVNRSRWNTVRYHLGTIAFGSAVITAIRIPRYILMYIYAKMKGSDNPLVKKLFFCCICTLGCIENCLNYINFNAYTVTAYTGQHFCSAAKTAVNILLDHAVEAASLKAFGSFFLFIGKTAVSSATAAFSYYLLKVSNCFLSIYEMVLDALFLCIAEDKDLSPDSSFLRQPRIAAALDRTLSMERLSNHEKKNYEEMIELMAR